MKIYSLPRIGKKSYPISSYESFVVFSTQSDQTVAHERRVRSHGGVTHIASDVAYVITAHGVIYPQYVSQNYLAKCELVTSLMRI
jgi:hypothetical protein